MVFNPFTLDESSLSIGRVNVFFNDAPASNLHIFPVHFYADEINVPQKLGVHTGILVPIGYRFKAKTTGIIPYQKEPVLKLVLKITYQFMSNKYWYKTVSKRAGTKADIKVILPFVDMREMT